MKSKQTRNFLTIDYRVLQLTQIVNKTTGEMLSWGAEYSVLYSYLKDKYTFFTHNNKQFYETFNTISAATGIQERTLKRKMKALVEIGLVSIDHIKLDHHIGFQKCNMYTIHDIPNFIDCSGDIQEATALQYVNNTTFGNDDIDKDVEDCPF